MQQRRNSAPTKPNKGHIQHNDVHCGITALQRKLKLQTRGPGYSKEVKYYIKRCPKCAEMKKIFKQSSLMAQRKRTMNEHPHG